MGSLQQAIANARKYNDKYETWCLIRLNKNDRTIETYQSQAEKKGPVFAPEPGSPLVFSLKKTGEIERTSTGAPKGGKKEEGGRVTWEKVGDFLIEARHAENYVCRGFAEILDSYKTAHGGTPLQVDLFIRDSPCLGNSMQEDAPYNVQGCAPKFINLKRQYAEIGTWALYYDRLYVSPQHKEEQAQQALKLLREAGFVIHTPIPDNPDSA